MEATEVGLQRLARFKKVQFTRKFMFLYRVEKVEVG